MIGSSLVNRSRGLWRKVWTSTSRMVSWQKVNCKILRFLIDNKESSDGFDRALINNSGLLRHMHAQFRRDLMIRPYGQVKIQSLTLLRIGSRSVNRKQMLKIRVW